MASLRCRVFGLKESMLNASTALNDNIAVDAKALPHLQIFSPIRQRMIPAGQLMTYGFTAGHSLGAALASLAAYDISAFSEQYGFSGRISCYTFGAPRVGDHLFARDFNVSIIFFCCQVLCCPVWEWERALFMQALNSQWYSTALSKTRMPICHIALSCAKLREFQLTLLPWLLYSWFSLLLPDIACPFDVEGIDNGHQEHSLLQALVPDCWHVINGEYEDLNSYCKSFVLNMVQLKNIVQQTSDLCPGLVSSCLTSLLQLSLQMTSSLKRVCLHGLYWH